MAEPMERVAPVKLEPVVAVATVVKEAVLSADVAAKLSEIRSCVPSTVPFSVVAELR